MPIPRCSGSGSPSQGRKGSPRQTQEFAGGIRRERSSAAERMARHDETTGGEFGTVASRLARRDASFRRSRISLAGRLV